MSDIEDVVIYKYYVEGKLIFKSPLVLGCGEESNSDKDISRDWYDKVFIPASGIAGPTRHYLDSILEDDKDQEHELIRQIFGEREKESRQSLITFYDGDKMEKCVVNIRDGVAIDYFTKTAKDTAKYNYEIMEPGASCRLRIELTIRGNKDKDNDEMVSKFENILFLVLEGFTNGNIRIGAKTARGFGEVELIDIKILKLNMVEAEDRDNWLNFDWKDFKEGNIQLNNLTHSLKTIQNKTNISVKFLIPHSLLIRAPNPDPSEEDVAHLSSNGKPVVSGTSWVGALRNAIIQVARELDKIEKIKKIMEPLFGYAKTREKEPNYDLRAQKSRLFINESVIEKGIPLNYTRNKIDRFTGGAVDTALFTEKATFGGNVELNIWINNAKEYEKGIVLLGIKELWHGLQLVGGGSNIGRGILEGVKIKLDAEEYDIKDINDDFNDIFKKYFKSLADVLV